MEGLFGIDFEEYAWSIVGLVFMGIYFFPTIIAFFTNSDQFLSVMIINAFFGWTILGWILALVMASKNNNRRRNIRSNKSNRIDQLESLANLRDRGVLTEREFEIQKQKVLK